MSRLIRSWVIAVSTVVTLLSNIAAAQDVAVLGSPFGGAPWNDDVQEKLMSTGFFNSVDIYDITTVTPTLFQLQQYCGVLVYSDEPGYQNPTVLGNNLADYVDGGGGVVVAVFAKASIPFGGRWASDSYWCLLPASQYQGQVLTLGTVHELASPLMQGVTSFNGGSSSYHGSGAPHALATVVAEWSNGRPLVLRRDIGVARRVDLNFFPVSDAERVDFWDQTTDGHLLMGNALVYVCDIPVPVQETTWSRVKAMMRP